MVSEISGAAPKLANLMDQLWGAPQLAPGIAAGSGGALVGPALLGGKGAGLVKGAALSVLAAALTPVFLGPLFAGLCWLRERCAGSRGSVNPLGTSCRPR